MEAIIQAPELSQTENPEKRVLLIQQFLETWFKSVEPVFQMVGAQPEEIAIALQLLAFEKANGICCQAHAAQVHHIAMEIYASINAPSEVV